MSFNDLLAMSEEAGARRHGGIDHYCTGEASGCGGGMNELFSRDRYIV